MFRWLLAMVVGVVMLLSLAALGALGSGQAGISTSGAFLPGAQVGLSPEEMQQAARALRVGDQVNAGELPMLAMLVAGLGESGFNPVPNAAGSGYCGVFQAHPNNIACDNTELQARSFFLGGLGFQAGGAIALSKTEKDPGCIATRVEASGQPCGFYGRFLSQAKRILAAWRAGGSTTLVVQPGRIAGTPKQIIDTVVLPLCRQAGINRSVVENDAANARHGPTVSGGTSDHQGPPSVAWAADISNGFYPTIEMDRCAQAIFKRFGMPGLGNPRAPCCGSYPENAVSATVGRYRIQVIFRSLTGGNHWNHVHAGIRRIG
jgi:hypothetical protein